MNDQKLRDVSRSGRLFRMGFDDGRDDRSHGREKSAPESFGDHYFDGYEEGYEAAKHNSWYVVSVDDDGTTSRWYAEDNPCRWVRNKSEATVFPTREAARDRSGQMSNILGRGTYTYVWC